MEVNIVDIKNSETPPIIEGDTTTYPGASLIPLLGDTWDGHIYVSGATGSGKSWLIAQILARDKRKRRIFYFSDLDDDTSLQILYDQGRVTKVVSGKIPNLEHSIVLFDDCTDKVLIQLRDHLLEKGRHQDTMIVCVNHKFRQWRATMMPLNESRWIITFPFSNKPNSIKILEGLSVKKLEAQEIVARSVKDGRYMIIHQFAPNFVMTQQSITRL